MSFIQWRIIWLLGASAVPASFGLAQSPSRQVGSPANAGSPGVAPVNPAGSAAGAATMPRSLDTSANDRQLGRMTFQQPPCPPSATFVDRRQRTWEPAAYQDPRIRPSDRLTPLRSKYPNANDDDLRQISAISDDRAALEREYHERLAAIEARKSPVVRAMELNPRASREAILSRLNDRPIEAPRLVAEKPLDPAARRQQYTSGKSSDGQEERTKAAKAEADRRTREIDRSVVQVPKLNDAAKEKAKEAQAACEADPSLCVGTPGKK